MRLPLEIVYRDVPKTEATEALIREKAARLDQFHERIMSCRVAVEKPHKHQRTGNGYRVRLDITVPPHKELVVDRSSAPDSDGDDLYRVVQEAFDAARKQLQKLAQRQRGDVKHHPAQQVQGFVSKLFEDYGFLETPDAREVYFHRNSLVGSDFDSLEIGDGVAFSETAGEEGPQASSVRILLPNRPEA